MKGRIPYSEHDYCKLNLGIKQMLLIEGGLYILRTLVVLYLSTHCTVQYCMYSTYDYLLDLRYRSHTQWCQATDYHQP